MNKGKAYFGAIATVIGTSIGAGIFGIPYAILKVGFFWGLIYFLVIGLAIILVTLCYSEIVLRTKQKMYFPGYAQKYLGKWGKTLGLVSMVIGIYGALVAYTLGVGLFLFELLGPHWGGSATFYSLVFYLICALIIFFGIKIVSGFEKYLVSFLLIIIGGILIYSLKYFETSNLFLNSALNFKDYLLPYGVLLFAVGASSVVPELETLLENDKKKIKKAILIGLLIPIIIYVLFALVVIGVNGLGVTEDGISGLVQTLGNFSLWVGSIFAIIAMTTSFISLGVVLKDTYHYDYKIKNILAWLLVMIIPLIIFLLNIVSFVQVLAIAGTLMGGLEGILIVMMYQRARKLGDEKPAYDLKMPKIILASIGVIFLFGILYQLIIFF